MIECVSFSLSSSLFRCSGLPSPLPFLPPSSPAFQSTYLDKLKVEVARHSNLGSDKGLALQEIRNRLRRHTAHPMGLLNHFQGPIAGHTRRSQGVFVVVAALLSLLDRLARRGSRADGALGSHPPIETGASIGHGVRREGVASVRGASAQVGLRVDGREEGGEAEGEKEEEGGDAGFARPASSPRWWWCGCLGGLHGLLLLVKARACL